MSYSSPLRLAVDNGPGDVADDDIIVITLPAKVAERLADVAGAKAKSVAGQGPATSATSENSGHPGHPGHVGRLLRYLGWGKGR